MTLLGKILLMQQPNSNPFDDLNTEFDKKIELWDRSYQTTSVYRILRSFGLDVAVAKDLIKKAGGSVDGKWLANTFPIFPFYLSAYRYSNWDFRSLMNNPEQHELIKKFYEVDAEFGGHERKKPIALMVLTEGVKDIIIHDAIFLAKAEGTVCFEYYKSKGGYRIERYDHFMQNVFVQFPNLKL